MQPPLILPQKMYNRTEGECFTEVPLYVRIGCIVSNLAENVTKSRRPQQKKSKMHSPFFADPPKQPTNCVTKCHNYN